MGKIMKKVSELAGSQLAYWAARAQNYELLPVQHNHDQQAWRRPEDGDVILVSDYQPQDNWAQCGALVDTFNVNVMTRRFGDNKQDYKADIYGAHAAVADNRKTAICRCVVASVYGEFVPSEGE